MLNLLLAMMAFLLIACGNDTYNHGYTKVTFAMGGNSHSRAKAISTAVDGGLLVYAVNVNTPNIRGSLFLNGPTSASMVIPKGNYRFYAVGAPLLSTSASYANLSQAYCGSSPVYGLTGGDLSVNMNISTAGCFSNPTFNAVSLQTASQNAIGSVYFTTCNALAYSSAVTYPADCSGGTGNIVSFRVRLLSYGTAFTGNALPDGQGMFSTCANFSTDSFNFSTIGVVGEPGNIEKPFMAAVEAYSSTNCTGFLGQYTFHDGFSNTSGIYPGGFAKSYSTTGGLRIFLKNLDGT